MSYYKIRPRSGTATQWATANPILAEREIGYEVPETGFGTGPVRMKMGDGVTAWNDLAYADPETGGGGDYLTPDDIVNNTETDDPTKVASASALKSVADSLTADNAQAFQFAYDSESGKYGYKVKEADTEVFVPFKGGLTTEETTTKAINKNNTYTVEFDNIPSVVYVSLPNISGVCNGGIMLVVVLDGVEGFNYSNIYNTTMSISGNTLTLTVGAFIASGSNTFTIHAWS